MGSRMRIPKHKYQKKNKSIPNNFLLYSVSSEGEDTENYSQTTGEPHKRRDENLKETDGYSPLLGIIFQDNTECYPH